LQQIVIQAEKQISFFDRIPFLDSDIRDLPAYFRRNAHALEVIVPEAESSFVLLLLSPLQADRAIREAANKIDGMTPLLIIFLLLPIR
jgi:hypothetical protein